jgi:hypothetical protein
MSLELHERGIHALWGDRRPGNPGLMVMAGKALSHLRTPQLKGLPSCRSALSRTGAHDRESGIDGRQFGIHGRLSGIHGWPVMAGRRVSAGYLYQMAVPGPPDLQSW